MINLSDGIAELVSTTDVPGGVGVILRNGQIIAQGSAGVRKIGTTDPFLPEDIVHIGSCGKAITAILICQLIEQGLFTFETTLLTIFPEMNDSSHEKSRPITIRHLLDHTAGLEANYEWRLMHTASILFMQSLEQQRYDVAKTALSSGSNVFTEINTYLYSNVGYVVLGAVIERITGQSWETVVRSNVFDVLGMTTAGFGVPGVNADGLNTTQPWGHTTQPTGVFSCLPSWLVANTSHVPVLLDNPPLMGPAGTIHCSLQDWAKFIAKFCTLAHLAACDDSGTAVSSRTELGVSVDTFKQCIAVRSAQQTYAGGWIVSTRQWAGGQTLCHSGSNTTWYCTVWIAPVHQTAYLVAFNTGGDPVKAVADKAIDRLIQVGNSIPTL